MDAFRNTKNQKRRHARRKHNPTRDGLSKVWMDLIMKPARYRRNRRKTAYVRKKRRQERMKVWRASFQRFIHNPFLRKRLSRRDRMLKKLYREEIRQQRKNQLLNAPSALASGIRRWLKDWKRKRERYFKTVRARYFSASQKMAVRELRADLVRTTVSSTVMFVIAFWAMYFTGQLVSVGVASHYSIPARIFSYQTLWPMFTHSSSYSRENIILIFGLGPLVCLTLGYLFYKILTIFQNRRIKAKVLLLWLAFHGMNLFFGGFIAGSASNTGMKYVTAWLLRSQEISFQELMLSGTAILMLLAIGAFATRSYLLVSSKQALVRPNLRFYYLVAQVFLPWLAGNVLIVMTNVPHWPPAFMIVQLTSILLVLPAFFNYNAAYNRRIRISQSGKEVAAGWLYILIFVVLTIIIRWFVYPGIHFGERL